MLRFYSAFLGTIKIVRLKLLLSIALLPFLAYLRSVGTKVARSTCLEINRGLPQSVAGPLILPDEEHPPRFV